MKKVTLLIALTLFNFSLASFELQNFSFDVPLGTSYDNKAAIVFARENPTENLPETSYESKFSLPFGFLGGIGMGVDFSLGIITLGFSAQFLEEIHFYPPDSADLTEEGAIDYYPFNYTYWTRTHVQQLHLDLRISYFLNDSIYFGVGGMYDLEFTGVHLGKDPDDLTSSYTDHETLFEAIKPQVNPQIYLTAHFGYIFSNPLFLDWKLGAELNFDAPLPIAAFFPEIAPYFIAYRFNLGGTLKLIYTF